MTQLVSFFLDHPLRHKSDQAYQQAYLIVICCLLTAGVDIFYIAISLLADFKQGVYLMSVAFSIYVLTAFLFRTGISNNILGNLYSANFFQVIMIMSLFSGGLKQHSFILPWLTVVPAIALLVANRTSAWIWFFICLLGLTGLAFLDEESTPILYNTKYDVMISILVYGGLILTALIINSVFEANKVKALWALEEANINIRKQNKEIKEQSNELRNLNESLHTLNNNLEKAVEERTTELNSKNQKLAQYAFLNAHKLRAPLARILGLVQLYRYPQLEESEEEYILDKLSSNANELDEVVSDINNRLESEELSKNFLADNSKSK